MGASAAGAGAVASQSHGNSLGLLIFYIVLLAIFTGIYFLWNKRK